MSPSPQGAGPSSAPLPPLGDMSTDPGGAGAGGGGFMQALMGAVTPVKASVDMINQACQKIVQSGAIPGAEQICGQIVQMANQLTIMAMQQVAQGGGMAPAPPAGGMGAPIGPPPGAPPMGQ